MPDKTEEGKASKKQQTLEDVDIDVKHFGLGIYILIYMHFSIWNSF